MKSSWQVAASLLLSAVAVHADPLACALGCSIPTSSVVFTDDPALPSYYVGVCQSVFRVQSTFLCMRNRCTAHQIQAGLKQQNSECEEYGSLELLPWSIIGNITQEDEAQFPSFNYNDSLAGGNLDPQVYSTPIILGDDIYSLALRTATAWDHSETTRANYGYAMYGFWGIVILIGFVNRLYTFATHRSHSSVSSKQVGSANEVKAWTKRYVTTPSLMGYHTSQPLGWCTIPPRLQSLTIMAFFVINVVLCAVSYDTFAGNLYWPRTSTQFWRYFADRTGVISMANMPLLWAFAMRNDVLIWLTGWSFTTFNQFHRWVARIATIEAVLHSIAYTVEAYQEGGKAEYVADWAYQYWWMGAIATIVMSLMCGLSIYPLRKLIYEAFLIIHILMAVLFLVGMYYHVAIFEGEYNPYIWACVAVWSFDRLLRILRLAYINLWACKATATFNEEANVVRLHVPVRSGLQVGPGTYYFVYVLNGLKFWESHPFTLSSWSDPSTTGSRVESGKSVSFIVRPHDSFTRRLRESTVRGRDSERGQIMSSVLVRVLIEGPYGTAHHLHSYDTILFVIGGSGITVALAHIHALQETLRHGDKAVATKKIHLVWAVQDRALFQDVLEHELASSLSGASGLTSHMEVHIDLYVTKSKISADPNTTEAEMPDLAESDVRADFEKAQGRSRMEPAGSSSQSDTDSAGEIGSVVNTYNHRPGVHDMIVSDALIYAVGGKKMALVCCGPAVMADDARAAAVDAMGRGCGGLDFFPESFNW